jgi:hypothetical protein
MIQCQKQNGDTTCTRRLTDNEVRRARDPPSILGRSCLSLNLNKINEETRRCTICWDEMGPKETFQLVDCHHQFHVRCLAEWAEGRGHNTCPMCRGFAAMDNQLKIGPATFELPDDSDSDDEILSFCPFSTSSYGFSNSHPNQPPGEPGPNPSGTQLASQNAIGNSIHDGPGTEIASETEIASLPAPPHSFCRFSLFLRHTTGTRTFIQPSHVQERQGGDGQDQCFHNFPT